MPTSHDRADEESVNTVKVPPESRASGVGRRVVGSLTPLPDEIGGYPIICSLGMGGMAQVYLCHAKGIGDFHKLIVVKAPRSEVLGDADTLDMFLNEARIAGRLNHPNVVQTNEVGMSGQLPFMALEYLDGQSLSAIQRKVGIDTLSADFQLRIIASALAGLHYAHQLEDYQGAALGIVHRDISPQNVFVTYDGITKLLDFGIAKASGTSNLTRDGVVKGKLAYMAPEQGALEKVDRRADIFSVGVMIWEAVTHRRLVAAGSDELSVLRRRVSGEDPKAHEVVADLPPELGAICTRAMARLPEERYQTALELKEALESYLLQAAPPTESAIGRFVSESFMSERAEMRLQIAEQVRRRAQPAAFHASVPPEPHEASTSATVRDATAEQLAITVQPARSRASATLIFGGVVAIAIAGIAVVAATVNGRHGVRGQAGSPSAAAAGQAPVRAAASETAADPALSPNRAAAARVRITMSTTPRSAELVVDGKPMSGGSFDAEVERSAEAHRIRVSAPGFSPSEQLVVFDRDVRLNVLLVPIPTSTSKAQVRAVPAASASTPKPATTAPGARTIYETDPYP
ncbi:hypothetical protein BH11MYX4_BH11MYX4_46480 [soil metagenome]